MINIPRWLVFLVAAWVIVFGIYRLHIARQRKKPRDPKRPNMRQGGLYAQSPRRHITFGLAYIVMGGVLVLMGFGVKLPIYGGCNDTASQAEEAPAGRSIEATTH